MDMPDKSGPMTIGEACVGRRNNFTLIRLIAAWSVLFAHSFALSTGRSGSDPLTHFLYPFWGQGLGTTAVLVFFVISGFLVTASYLHREDLLAFLEARALRIFPGLVIAVLFCVFVVGLFSTSLEAGEYLRRPATWQYFWHNITLFGGVAFRLPGVFEDNPWRGGVNGSLWTLPVELYMYCIVAMLGALSILKSRPAANAFVLLSLVGLFFLYHGWFHVPGFPKKHALLIIAYLLGLACYVNRKHIPLNFVVLLVLLFVAFLVSGSRLQPIAFMVAFAYLVLFVALSPSMRLPSMDGRGDFSYGLYIYAFPIQQILAAHVTRDPWQMLVYSTLITFPMAMLSWFFIEKPALRLKGRLPLGRRWLDPRVREA